MFETIGLNPALIETGGWDRLCSAKRRQRGRAVVLDGKTTRCHSRSVGKPRSFIPMRGGGGEVTAATALKRRAPRSLRKTGIGLA